MYTLKITDYNGEYIEYKNIIKVIYSTGIEKFNLENDDIFNHKYYRGYDLHLYSKKDAYTIPGNKILKIQVTKEDI